MKLKLTLSLLLLLAGAYLSAQTFLPREGFLPGKLIYTNGEVKTGFIAAPKKSNQSFIYYKSDKDAKKVKIKSILLDSISMKTDEKNTSCFERLGWTLTPKGKIRKQRWFYVTVKGYANLYILADKFIIDKKGRVIFVTNSQAFYYLLRKRNEKVAHYFLYVSTAKMNITVGSMLKQNAPKYFSEDADLMQKINTKKLKAKNVEEVVNIYNDYMDKKE